MSGSARQPARVANTFSRSIARTGSLASRPRVNFDHALPSKGVRARDGRRSSTRAVSASETPSTLASSVQCSGRKKSTTDENSKTTAIANEARVEIQLERQRQKPARPETRSKDNRGRLITTTTWPHAPRHIENCHGLTVEPSNNALVLTLPASGRRSGVGGLRSGAAPPSSARRHVLDRGERRPASATQHSASRWTAPIQHDTAIRHLVRGSQDRPGTTAASATHATTPSASSRRESTPLLLCLRRCSLSDFSLLPRMRRRT